MYQVDNSVTAVITTNGTNRSTFYTIPITSGTLSMSRFRLYINIGGSRWGACRAHTPPMGPNSFIFAYIFTEKHLCWRSTPPPPNGCMPPYGKSWICHCINIYNLPSNVTVLHFMYLPWIKHMKHKTDFCQILEYYYYYYY